jgi:hypothetical protein
MKTDPPVRVAFLGPTGCAASMLDDLTAHEVADLQAWSDQQPRNEGESVDLGGWPGWKDVIARRFRERFGIDMPQAGP